MSEFEADGYSGKAFHKKILDRLCQDEACFARGTPVWTDKGLVPIEQIKVGDLVLSKPEGDDNAPLAYKPVTKIFSRESDVCFIEVYRNNPNYTEDGNDCPLEFSGIIATYDHPFWGSATGVREWNWWPLSSNIQTFRLQDGGECESSSYYSVRQWLDENEQPVNGLALASDKYIVGMKIDFNQDPPWFYLSDNINLPVSPSDAGFPRDNYVATVFNITVDDFHTYFVGDWGLWVHNSCFVATDLGLRINEPGGLVAW